MKLNIILYILFIILLSSLSYAYVFDYPTPYYYDKQNIKIDLEFIGKFEDATPDYLRDNLDIEFTTKKSSYAAYTYCYSKEGKITITMYRDSWIDYDYGLTGYYLWHELKHVYQCRILKEYPHHEKSFREIEI